jgi:hypothetical protein
MPRNDHVSPFNPHTSPNLEQATGGATQRPPQHINPGGVQAGGLHRQAVGDPSHVDPSGPSHVDPALFPPRDTSRPRDLSDLGDLRVEGLLWVLSCNNEQTHHLVEVLGVLGPVITAPGGPATTAVLASCLGYIESVNKLGGSNGVEITGRIGSLGVVVTPRWAGLFGKLVQASRLAVSGATMMDFIIQASARIPALAQALNLPVVATVFSQVAMGTPLGWAIAAGAGLLIHALEPDPDPNAHGAVMADRDQALAWETFLISHLDNHGVALLSWRGLLSAQGGGGAGVYANRPQVGPWETWTLLDNHDGTFSLQTINQHYLCAEEGGGRECQADRPGIGDWEKFYLVPLPGGAFALKTLVRGKFVSVQP